jgi:two-component system LytT family response regulator
VTRSVRVLIVDDEPLARRGVRLRLEGIGGFEIVGESGSGREAIADIARTNPDVVFLDVQMPGIDGFGVVDAVGVGKMPATIFVTAHDQHALRAFEAHAIDYVLKPIDDRRFTDAVTRVRRLVDAGRVTRHVVLRDGQRALVVDPAELEMIEADGDYVRVRLGGRPFLVRQTLASIIPSLPGFVRVHRSAAVNARRVREVSLIGDRKYRVTMESGAVVNSSRGYRDEVARLLGAAGE